MLGDEDGVSPHGRLATVIAGLGSGEPVEQELSPVLQHDGPALFGKIPLFLKSQPKATAKLTA